MSHRMVQIPGGLNSIQRTRDKGVKLGVGGSPSPGKSTQWAIQGQNVSPENVHTSNIVWTLRVIFGTVVSATSG